MAVLKRKQIKLYVHRTMYILHIDALENDVAIEKNSTIHYTLQSMSFCFGKKMIVLVKFYIWLEGKPEGRN